MKHALVTGASSGIGRKISEALVQDGFEVWSIGRTFQKQAETSLFHPLVCDLRDTDRLLQLTDSIR